MSISFNYLGYNVATPSMMGETEKPSMQDILSNKAKKEDYFFYLKPKNEFDLDIMTGKKTFLFTRKLPNYQKDNVQKLVLQSMYQLNQAKADIDVELFDLAKRHLFLMYQVVSSNGWKNNKLIDEEVEVINSLIREFFEFTPSIIYSQEDEAFVEKELSIIKTETGHYRTKKLQLDNDYKNLYSIALFYDKEEINEVEKFECTVNLLNDFVNSIKVEKSYNREDVDYTKGETDLNIHEDLIYLTKSIMMSLTYTINCTSWLKNSYFAFDKHDLTRKIKGFPLISEGLYE